MQVMLCSQLSLCLKLLVYKIMLLKNSGLGEMTLVEWLAELLIVMST